MVIILLPWYFISAYPHKSYQIISNHIKSYDISYGFIWLQNMAFFLIVQHHRPPSLTRASHRGHQPTDPCQGAWCGADEHRAGEPQGVASAKSLGSGSRTSETVLFETQTVQKRGWFKSCRPVFLAQTREKI